MHIIFFFKSSINVFINNINKEIICLIILKKFVCEKIEIQ